MKYPKIIALMLATTLLATMVAPPLSLTADTMTKTQVNKQTAIAVGTKRKTKTNKIKSAVGKTHVAMVKQVTKVKKWNVPLSQNLQAYIAKLCSQDGVNPKVVYGVMTVETGGSFNPNLVSYTNDYGLMQINSVNRGWLSRKLGITNWFDPYQNSKAGIYMLGQLTKKYHNINEVLLAYHLGQGGMNSSIRHGIWNTSYTLKAFDAMSKLQYV